MVAEAQIEVKRPAVRDAARLDHARSVANRRRRDRDAEVRSPRARRVAGRSGKPFGSSD